MEDITYMFKIETTKDGLGHDMKVKTKQEIYQEDLAKRIKEFREVRAIIRFSICRTHVVYDPIGLPDLDETLDELNDNIFI
jgi:hypothetical protein